MWAGYQSLAKAHFLYLSRISLISSLLSSALRIWFAYSHFWYFFAWMRYSGSIPTRGKASSTAASFFPWEDLQSHLKCRYILTRITSLTRDISSVSSSSTYSAKSGNWRKAVLHAINAQFTQDSIPSGPMKILWLEAELWPFICRSRLFLTANGCFAPTSQGHS